MKTTCFFFSIIVFFLLGCDKYKAKKMAGIYDCKVHSSYFTGGTSNVSDYEEALEIKQDGKNLVIFNELFHPVAVKLIDHCDAVLRIGGPSAGADEMVNTGKAKGKLIFMEMKEIPQLNNK